MMSVIYTWPTKKNMAIHDYIAITSRSGITKCIKKTMVIDRIQTCIFYDCGRIAAIAARSLQLKQNRMGYFEYRIITSLISQMFMV